SHPTHWSRQLQEVRRTARRRFGRQSRSGGEAGICLPGCGALLEIARLERTGRHSGLRHPDPKNKRRRQWVGRPAKVLRARKDDFGRGSKRGGQVSEAKMFTIDADALLERLNCAPGAEMQKVAGLYWVKEEIDSGRFVYNLRIAVTDRLVCSID